MAQGGGAPPPEAVKKGMSRTLIVTVLIVVAVLAFAGGIGIDRLVLYKPPTPTTFVVGTNVPFPPFEDFNASTGQFVGFDMDLSQLIANRMGRTLIVRQFANFQVLLATVGTGGVDMAASSITMSGDPGRSRNATMSFSNPYYDANQGVLVKTGTSFTCANHECTADQMKTWTIAVQLGTTSESWVRTNVGPLMANNQTQIVGFTGVDTEIAALKAGTVNAVVIDYGPAQAIAGATGSGLTLVGEIITNELYGFAVAHGDPNGYVPIINSVLADAMANGTYNQLITKWFG
jgi:polar amino acid transport system substrate-binding protein